MQASVKGVASMAILITIVVSASGACTPDGRACSPGDPLPCSCADGHVGVQTCDSLGGAYGPCDCTADGGASNSDAAVSDAASADASPDASTTDAGLCVGMTNLPLSCPCTDASQCADGVCHDYGAKGVRCTKHCTQTSDCPPPSTKCSPMSMVCNTP